MTKGAHRKYDSVKCPKCGKKVGMTYLARHMKECD